ncbi:MAG: peptidoglycan DL-endopeptidase CwlO [Microbacteriaceae bacterium]|nr:peptidoglycan DL-endopeptidase CwlO [Microbacteriaceae bacterium]
MTFTEMVGSIQQIRAQLAQLSAPAPSSTSGADFAAALQAADAPSGATPTTAVSGSLVSGQATGEAVVQSALKYQGVPYVLGGESKSGMDCSGLVQRAFADLGVSVPRLVHQQQTIGQSVGSLKDAKPGDLIVLNGGDHIAIWAGDGKVIHAPYEGRTVSLQKAWFTDKDVVTIRRVVPSAADVAASASASPDALLSSLGSWGSTAANPSTAQQLLAARAALGTENA